VNRLDGRASRVGVFAYRSETAYTGVLTALFSGAAYVPLNRTFPPERTRAMCQAADLDAIIVDAASAGQLADVLRGLDRPRLTLLPDEVRLNSAAGAGTQTILCGQDLKRSAALEALPPVSTVEIAYLLFTSGSTGAPKGVGVTHGNVLHFIDVMTERYGIVANDRFSQTFDQTFDLSVFDMFVAWERGACVCVPQPLDLITPVRFTNQRELTVWFSVPSIPALAIKKGFLKPDSLPTLRWSLFCGEPLPRQTAEAWQAAAPKSVLENLYGPTELTIACLLHRWDPERSPGMCVNDVVPIGSPYPGLGAVVVDEQLRPVAHGETGELCVCGPQTAPGYWRDPTKTAERFVELAAPDLAGIWFYRTGDRVRRLDSGDYVYLGRTDHQVKVLGHRVELGEIEAVLLRQAGVVQAVALGWPVEGGSAQGIVAFVNGSKADGARIQQAAREVLPDYMTPRKVFVVDAFPLNANGKVDRIALAAGLDAGKYV
jgi:amino acid adenylation domain-containing protein